MFGNVGGSELFLILLIVLVFFGPSKLPELAKGMGKAISEFKKASRDIEDELRKEVTKVDETIKKIEENVPQK
jgi:TatA/E family protein of Tat protein translocase